MCLAVPPTNRTQAYAIPFAFPLDASSLIAADVVSSSSSAAARCSVDGSKKHKADNPRYFDVASSSPLPRTPPPVDVVESFPGALGPTGLSPIVHYSQPNTFHLPVAPAMAVFSAHLNLPTSAPLAPSSKVGPSKTTTIKRRRRGPQRPGKTATDKERLFVKHDYHDLSGQPDDVSKGDGLTTTTKKPSTSNPATESFPLKLHRILGDSTDDTNSSHIISWQPHGRAFKIHNPKQFTEHIMPRYFPKMKKLTSLQRQFNLYGFERLTREGPDAGAYYHEAFLRHRPVMSARRMIRRRVKGTGYKAASNPEAEPNLYTLPFMKEVMDAVEKEQEDGAKCHQEIAAMPVNSNDPFFCPSELLPFSLYDGARNEEDTGMVTESTKSNSSLSGSSSDESSLNQEMELKQWFSSPSPPMMAEAVYSSNPYAVDTERNNQDSDQNSSISSPSMGDFLSLPEATQDSFLQDFFSANDVTPLSPEFNPSSTNRASSAAAATVANVSQQKDDRGILMEFADLWESSVSHLKLKD